MLNKPRAAIFDIDGTLADMEHRKHLAEKKEWDAFFTAMPQDAPKQPIIDLLKMYYHFGHAIILVTGRPKTYENHTREWLRQHGILPYVRDLYMRPAADKRGDDEVKKEIFLESIGPLFDTKYVIDDRNKVVNMWRSLGLTVLQCAPGDF